MGQDPEIRQGAHPDLSGSGDTFRQWLAEDRRSERRLFWCELIALGAVLSLVLLRLQFDA